MLRHPRPRGSCPSTRLWSRRSPPAFSLQLFSPSSPPYRLYRRGERLPKKSNPIVQQQQQQQQQSETLSIRRLTRAAAAAAAARFLERAEHVRRRSNERDPRAEQDGVQVQFLHPNRGGGG